MIFTAIRRWLIKTLIGKWSVVANVYISPETVTMRKNGMTVGYVGAERMKSVFSVSSTWSDDAPSGGKDDS